VSICTVAGAEDHLVNHLNDIAYASLHSILFYFSYSKQFFAGTGQSVAHLG
jgi:hypothetical protein